MAKTNKKPLDPYKIVLVCKFKGKEVGRIAATAPNAEQYMTELTRHYGELEVAYEKDPDAWLMAAMRSKT